MNYKQTKIACYVGFTVQAVINNFLPILFVVFQSNYALNYEKLGRLLFINFSIQIISDILTPYISKFIGYRKTILLSHFLAAAGLCLLCILPSVFSSIYTAMAVSIAVYAFGSGVIEVILSPLVSVLPSKSPSASMAFTHSFYCWGQVATVILTSAMVTLFGFSGWRFIPLLWAVVPAVNFVLFLFVPIKEPAAAPKEENRREIFKTREFFCFAVFMVCAGVSEITMSEWTSVFAQNSLGISKYTGDLLGPGAFAVCMGAGRMIFGSLSGRFSVRRALIINNFLCFLCYLAVGISNSPVLSLLACALCGLTVSLSWPGTYSLGASRFPNGGTFMFGVFALCGDLGCSAGPWLLGFVADKISIKAGFSVCSVFPLLMAVTALFVLKEKDCKPHFYNV